MSKAINEKIQRVKKHEKKHIEVKAEWATSPTRIIIQTVKPILQVKQSLPEPKTPL